MAAGGDEMLSGMPEGEDDDRGVSGGTTRNHGSCKVVSTATGMNAIGSGLLMYNCL